MLRLDISLVDMNILRKHQEILDLFKKFRKKRMIELKKSLDSMRDKLKNEIMTVSIRQESIDKYTREYNEFIDLRDNNGVLSKYKERSSPILDEYEVIGPTVKTIDYTDTFVNEDENVFRRIQLTNAYINILKDYFSLNVMDTIPNVEYCQNCNNCDFEEDSSTGIEICKSCGTQKEIRGKITSISFNKTDPRKDSEDRTNFIRALDRFQGKRVGKIPSDIVERLDLYFSKEGLQSSDIIRSMNTNEHGRKEGTNKRMMYRALQDTGMGYLCEFINYICHIVWGWKLPNLVDIEDDVKEMYDNVSIPYEKVKASHGQISVNFRLFKILEAVGYGVLPDDFHEPRTFEVRENRDEGWKQVCKLSNCRLKYIRSI